jgi:hypothetical protein
MTANTAIYKDDTGGALNPKELVSSSLPEAGRNWFAPALLNKAD